jgi:small subunit ribosomal protein S17
MADEASEEMSDQVEETGRADEAGDTPATAGTEPATATGDGPEPAPAPTPAVTVSRTGQERVDENGVRIDRHKVREGLVVSTAMDKTAVVAVVERVRHPRYAKTVQRTKRFYAHDEHNDLRVGDRVRLSETRPFSKLKRWRVTEVLERAK